LRRMLPRKKYPQAQEDQQQVKQAGGYRKNPQHHQASVTGRGQAERPNSQGRKEIKQRWLVHLPAFVGQGQSLFLQDVINVLLVTVAIKAEERRQLRQVV